MSRSPDAHEWVSFEDPDEQRTWMCDATFLESSYTCIFGRGCQGILSEPTPELSQGCCSYGAHFVDDEDVARVELAAKRLSADQWQFRDKGRGKKGVTTRNDEGDVVTRLVDDACIFLNRPDFPRGAGCALHVLALDSGESFIPLKPEVCWQVPLRREDLTLANGEVLTRIAQWNRSDWGEGGEEFHWWCTQDPGAFVGDTRVVDSMKDELTAMMGPANYDTLVDLMNERRRGALPHPVEIRRRN
ncbi:MAG: hypothetical protein KGR42_06490 [Acidobacteria bacterium]|nr:hypothetical protein [Acidobacteriota bacterium]